MLSFLRKKNTEITDAEWKTVAELKVGMQIAVPKNGILDVHKTGQIDSRELFDGGDVLWDEIESIEYVGTEQVWDIEVEGTHNFIGNNIFAHNTYMSGNLEVAGTVKITGGSPGASKVLTSDANGLASWTTLGSGSISDIYLLNTGDTGSGAYTFSGGIFNVNASSNFATNINTGTSTGAVSIGGGSNTFAIASTGLDVSTTGALSGITTITTSGAINSQTISSTANFTGTVAVATSIRAGATAMVSSALIGAVAGGNGFEFGHTNSAGYRGTLGAEASSGANFIAFNSEAGTTANTYRTRGVVGSVMKSDNGGGFTFNKVATATADNQALTNLMTISNAGVVTAAGSFSGNITGTVTGHSSLDLALTGGTMTGDITSNSNFVSTARNKGVVGTYNSTLTDQVWSIGAAYTNNATGADFGNLYGMAYCHTNNANCTSGLAHQIEFVNNGTVGTAIGLAGGIWTNGAITATGAITGSNLSGTNTGDQTLAGLGGAPVGAKYIVQTADATLTGEQALGALGTGILKNTTTTGVLSIAIAVDFPTLNQNTTGTAAGLSATLVSTSGGSGVNNAGTLTWGSGGTLGTAAYTASTAYATAAQGTLATNAIPKGIGTNVGDLISFSAASTPSRIAAVATGQPLISKGINTLPAYAGYTFAGTAAQTYTFPTTTATLARTDAAQTFTGTQTFSGTVTAPDFIVTSGTISDADTAYVTFADGIYSSTGTSYFAGLLNARGGIGNDNATYLAINGGTSGYTYFAGNVGIGTIVPSGILSVTPSQYNTGTASQSLTTVTGVGTTWTSAMVGSQFVYADGTNGGTITAFGSATSLTVSTSQTVASQAYKIAYTGLQVGSTGNVGIGTTAPIGQLQITDTTAASATRGLLITQHNSGVHAPLFTTRKSRGTEGSPTAVASGDYLGLFDWSGYVGGTNTYKQGARIIAIVNGTVTDSSAGIPTELGFFTNQGDGSVGLTERLRITKAGNVGIGTTNPTAKLVVSGDIYLDSGANRNIKMPYLSSGSGADLTIEAQSTDASGNGGDLFLGAGLVGTPTSLTNGGSVYIYPGTGNSNGNVILGHSGSSAIGNVGIGTTSPGASLSIGDTNTQKNAEIFGWLCVISPGKNCTAATDTGTIYAEVTTVAQADYAEYFYTKDIDLKAGEAVCVDITVDNGVKRCDRPGDGNLMGIVSTKPGVLGNVTKETKDNPNYIAIAMIGQIPGKINSENGLVRRGDNLTSSSIPGIMMKAGPEDPTVGVALNSARGLIDTIQIVISRRNQSLTVSQVEEQITKRIASMELEDEVTLLIDKTLTELKIEDYFASNADRSTKRNIKSYTNNEEALALVLNVPLNTFYSEEDVLKYGDTSPLIKTRLGFLADETDPFFLKENKKIDQESVNGLLIASIKALNLKIEEIGKTETLIKEEEEKPSWYELAENLFNDVFEKVEGSVLYIKDLAVRTLKIGSPEKRTGITFYDEVNGNPYCFSIANGETKTMLGECTIITPPPTDEGLTYSPEDTNAPIITLDGDILVSLDIGSSYTEAGAIAVDDVDGEVAMIISGSVDTTIPGTYTITYTATDTAGNTATPVVRTVNVGDVTTIPTFEPITTESGTTQETVAPEPVSTTEIIPELTSEPTPEPVYEPTPQPEAGQPSAETTTPEPDSTPQP